MPELLLLPVMVDTPVPAKVISTVGLAGSLLVMVSVAVLLPAEAGVWVRVTVQLLPTAIAGEALLHGWAPPLVFRVNIAESVPPIVMEEI